MTLLIGTLASALDTVRRQVVLADGRMLDYGALSALERDDQAGVNALLARRRSGQD